MTQRRMSLGNRRPEVIRLSDHLCNHSDAAAVSALRAEIERTTEVAEREWLLGQV